mmetsp:Transcript_22661/g.89656  ORF Transcript_22661/g.89656 Transcript_22661/m.89656 type:complete len:576 (-) Transcript_22661:779-2506(-)
MASFRMLLSFSTSTMFLFSVIMGTTGPDILAPVPPRVSIGRPAAERWRLRPRPEPSFVSVGRWKVPFFAGESASASSPFLLSFLVSFLRSLPLPFFVSFPLSSSGGTEFSRRELVFFSSRPRGPAPGNLCLRLASAASVGAFCSGAAWAASGSAVEAPAAEAEAEAAAAAEATSSRFSFFSRSFFSLRLAFALSSEEFTKTEAIALVESLLLRFFFLVAASSREARSGASSADLAFSLSFFFLFLCPLLSLEASLVSSVIESAAETLPTSFVDRARDATLPFFRSPPSSISSFFFLPFLLLFRFFDFLFFFFSEGSESSEDLVESSSEGPESSLALSPSSAAPFSLSVSSFSLSSSSSSTSSSLLAFRLVSSDAAVSCTESSFALSCWSLGFLTDASSEAEGSSAQDLVFASAELSGFTSSPVDRSASSALSAADPASASSFADFESSSAEEASSALSSGIALACSLPSDSGVEASATFLDSQSLSLASSFSSSAVAVSAWATSFSSSCFLPWFGSGTSMQNSFIMLSRLFSRMSITTARSWRVSCALMLHRAMSPPPSNSLTRSIYIRMLMSSA